MLLFIKFLKENLICQSFTIQTRFQTPIGEAVYYFSLSSTYLFPLIFKGKGSSLFYLRHIKLFYISILITYLTAFSQESPQAQKETPNYDFSIENLEVFFPNSTRVEIEKKVGKGTLIKTNGDLIIRKYYVAQLRYKFPVFVQFYKICNTYSIF